MLFQELCLNIIPTFASLVDYTALKNSIVPRIKKLCLTTNTLSVRIIKSSIILHYNNSNKNWVPPEFIICCVYHENYL